ncbi:Wzz/FepE/Etk N-terminal domain-containing protein, partial [Pseudoalteromonas sp. SR45-5]|uniref:Wzz/FepE/Etk N-terminal domain-containing protein n=1 Tax=Pseudoalteromonas sp. SR45-5 TaxID=2760928 RepID=UPI0017983E43
MNKFENNSIDSEDVIDFTVYLKVIQRAKWRIIGFSVVVTLLTIMFALTLVPQYTASATLLIESEQSKAVSFEEIYGLDTTKKEYYLTQFEILKSDSIGREVITKLNLEEHSDFIPKPSFMGEVKGYVKGLLPFLNKNE